MTSRAKWETLTKQQRVASQMLTIHIILLYAWEGNYWFPVFLEEMAQSFQDEGSVCPRPGLQTEAIRRLRTCCFSPWNLSADIQELLEQTWTPKEEASPHELCYSRFQPFSEMWDLLKSIFSKRHPHKGNEKGAGYGFVTRLAQSLRQILSSCKS